jgi:hypothetical protein
MESSVGSMYTAHSNDQLSTQLSMYKTHLSTTTRSHATRSSTTCSWCRSLGPVQKRITKLPADQSNPIVVQQQEEEPHNLLTLILGYHDGYKDRTDDGQARQRRLQTIRKTTFNVKARLDTIGWDTQDWMMEGDVRCMTGKPNRG